MHWQNSGSIAWWGLWQGQMYWQNIVVPLDDGTTTCKVALEEGETIVRVQVTDPQGASGLASLDVNVIPTLAPQVDIFSPISTETYYTEELILFSADVQNTPQDETLKSLISIPPS